jgi:two-component system nitrogen regulation response regulator GlnG
LRVLTESEFYRVGGQSIVAVDVRVIAATNQDLARAVENGRFREDLYHRLNIIRINTPPLRQRRQDIPLLLRHYLDDAAQELDVPVKTVNSEAMDILQNYDWPGNMRQLVNVSRRMMVTAPGGVIAAIDVPEDVDGGKGGQQEWTQNFANWAEKELESGERSPLIETALPEFEKTLMRIALKQAQGHRQQAARLGPQYTDAKNSHPQSRLKDSRLLLKGVTHFRGGRDVRKRPAANHIFREPTN